MADIFNVEDDIYLVASCDQEAKEVYLTFDINEAGRKYAEIKSNSDVILWHIRKEDLNKRMLNDFERPIEIVDDEMLLEILSSIVNVIDRISDKQTIPFKENQLPKPVPNQESPRSETIKMVGDDVPGKSRVSLKGKYDYQEIMMGFMDYLQEKGFWIDPARKRPFQFRRVMDYLRYIDSIGKNPLNYNNGEVMIEDYRHHLQTKGLKKDSIISYISIVRLFYKYITNLEDQIIECFKTWLEEKGYKSRSSNTFIHGYVTCVKDFWEFVKDNDLKLSHKDETTNKYMSYLRSEKLLTNGSVGYYNSAVRVFYIFLGWLNLEGI